MRIIELDPFEFAYLEQAFTREAWIGGMQKDEKYGTIIVPTKAAEFAFARVSKVS